MIAVLLLVPLNLISQPSHASPHPVKFGNVTPARLARAASEPGQWLTGGRDYQQSYYSPLTQVDKNTVSKLGYAWSYDIDFDAPFQATPIMVDGVLFASSTRGRVHALNAATGKLRWSFEPRIDPDIFRQHCCGGVNRGVAVWRGKVYTASVDGYLYALDAETGAVKWKVDTIVDRSRSYSSTGAPYIAKDLVVIGNSGAEYDARGYITAYDTQTGKLAWRFFTVPGDPKKGFEHPELKLAAKTWDPNSLWEVGGGGTAWDGMAYDPGLNLLYVGTGNGDPWNRKVRSPAGGDNLFLSSIIAITPDTGRMAWYYQTTPGDSWDFTATQKMILADLKIGGRTRKVIMQAPKNGFFYVLDRKTGELLSARTFAYVNWASHVDLKTGRPIETGKADYSQSPKLVFPSDQGAHNWNPMSFNSVTALVYLPVLEQGEVYGNLTQPFGYVKGGWNTGTAVHWATNDATSSGSKKIQDWPPFAELRKGEPDPTARTYLRAWDPVQQKLVWELETTDRGSSGVRGARSLSGVMSTAAGLVFQGHIDGHFRAFDASTGEKLHDIEVGTSMIAASMTYSVNGQQYIAIMAGVNAHYDAYADARYGNKGRVVAFKIGGGEVPQRPLLDRNQRVIDHPPLKDFGTAEKVQLGARLFAQHCAVCHEGPSRRAPDLTQMTADEHREFLDIVRMGSRVNKGMGNFGAILSESEAVAIHAFITHSQWLNYRHTKEGKPN